jgi:hypothetical protein
VREGDYKLNTLSLTYRRRSKDRAVTLYSK